jgi:rhodanese-related sulfurtransferase
MKTLSCWCSGDFSKKPEYSRIRTRQRPGKQRFLPSLVHKGRLEMTHPTNQLHYAPTMKKILTLLFSLLFTASVFAGEFPDIAITDVKKAIAEKKITIIDVNGSDSWKSGHVPTAIDFEGAGDKLAAQLPKDKGALVVAYCGGPSCGAYKAAAKKAQELGYTNVKHMAAGISGWKSAGEKTEAGK